MEEEKPFKPKHLTDFLNRVLYAHRVKYPVVKQFQSPSQPSSDVYFVALQKMSGKELTKWDSELNAKHSLEESKGMYPYLQGRVNYKSFMKFSDGNTVELEIEYYSGFLSSELEKIINVLSLYGDLDLPDVDFFDVKEVKGTLKGSNRLEAVSPFPEARVEYETEFKINVGDSDVVIKHTPHSRNEFLVEYKGVKKLIADGEMLNYEGDLISMYFSSQNVQCNKPKIRINGKDGNITQYLDGLLSSSLDDAVYKDIRDSTLHFGSVAKKLPNLEKDVAELEAKLQHVRKDLPEDVNLWPAESRNMLEKIDSELSSRNQRLNSYVSQLRSYGNLLVSLESMGDSLRSLRFNETYKKYQSGVNELLTKKFMQEVKNILAKYRPNNPMFFLNSQFAEGM